MFETDLIAATVGLPLTIRSWMWRAIRSGWFRLEPGEYEGDNAVCPITAAATMAGVWDDGAVRSGSSEWGDSTGPTPAIEEFAAWFDLVAEAHGATAALQIVSVAIGPVEAADAA